MMSRLTRPYLINQKHTQASSSASALTTPTSSTTRASASWASSSIPSGRSCWRVTRRSPRVGAVRRIQGGGKERESRPCTRLSSKHTRQNNRHPRPLIPGRRRRGAGRPRQGRRGRVRACRFGVYVRWCWAGLVVAVSAGCGD